MLPTHAEALDKALKVEWMREMVNAESKAGEKKRHPRVIVREKRKGVGEIKRIRNTKLIANDVVTTMTVKNALGQRGHVFDVAKRVI